MSAIQATDLVRRFGEVEAVRGVSLEVAEGEIYGFLGPNGAGKSTIVRILTTLLQPTGGSGAVLGHDVTREPTTVRRLIGVAGEIAEIAYNEPDDVTKALDEAETKVFEVAE